MSEHTLEVPAEYVEPLRVAALVEVQGCGEMLASNAEELLGDVAKAPEGHDCDAADVIGTAGLVAEDVSILHQLIGCPEGQAVTLRCEPSALAHTAETAARKVLEPRLSGEIDCGPFNEEAVEKIGQLSAALGWATGEAARLHAVAGAEIDAERAAA